MQMFLGDKLCQAFQKTGDHVWTSIFVTPTKEPLKPFRYFRLRVDSVADKDRWLYSTGYCIQFSRIEFIDDTGNQFSYPYNTTAIATNIGASASSEDIINCLDHSVYTKTCLTDCFANALEPVYITFDMKEECLDLQQFTKWEWWTANDTSGYPNRNLKTYSLQVSNDGVEWIVVDSVVDGQYTSSNYSKAYTGDIVVES